MKVNSAGRKRTVGITVAVAVCAAAVIVLLALSHQWGKDGGGSASEIGNAASQSSESVESAASKTQSAASADEAGYETVMPWEVSGVPEEGLTSLDTEYAEWPNAVLTDKGQLDAYVAAYRAPVARTATNEPVYNGDEFAGYGEDFFERYDMLVVGFCAGSGSYKYEIEGVVTDGDRTSVCLKVLPGNGMSMGNISPRMYILGVPKRAGGYGKVQVVRASWFASLGSDGSLTIHLPGDSKYGNAPTRVGKRIINGGYYGVGDTVFAGSADADGAVVLTGIEPGAYRVEYGDSFVSDLVVMPAGVFPSDVRMESAVQ